jgi:hypothetical protein
MIPVGFDVREIWSLEQSEAPPVSTNSLLRAVVKSKNLIENDCCRMSA